MGAAHPADQLALAEWTQAIQPTVLQQMLSLASGEDVISFALGLPAPELFPAPAFQQAAARLLERDPAALQYGPPSASLKAAIVALMRQRGIECQAGGIFLTNGAQQAVTMLARLLLDQGGSVLCEEIVYTGFQQVLDPFAPRILTVPSDPQTGIDVDAVEAHLRGGERPAFIYTITDGHNPLGSSMSREKRARLAGLARQYRVPIIEDDAYGFLAYGEQPEPPLRALDDEWVLYVGSFSKILAPALRVGWIIAPEALMDKLSIVKEASDIGTATFSQRLVAEYLESNDVMEHVRLLRHSYRERRDAMIQALQRYFPAGVSWHAPENGMFIWAVFPAGVDTLQLLKRSLETARVAFIPGQVFGINGAPASSQGIRLNFSNCSPARIDEGIRRLGALLDAQPD